MSFKPSTVFLASVIASLALTQSVSAQDAKLAPPVTQNGITTQKAKASQTFPLLKGFLAMPIAQRDQIQLGYILRVKKAPLSSISATLTHQGATTPIIIAADGRITTLPSLAQMNDGAEVTISGPEKAAIAMKLKIYSTQGLKTTYDATGLAKGVTQGNDAARKIAGPIASIMPKLDRVYFVGASGANVEIAPNRTTALPTTSSNAEYPAGTPYFEPKRFATATKISFKKAPTSVLFDTAPKK